MMFAVPDWGCIASGNESHDVGIRLLKGFAFGVSLVPICLFRGVKFGSLLGHLFGVCDTMKWGSWFIPTIGVIVHRACFDETKGVLVLFHADTSDGFAAFIEFRELVC